MNTQEQQVRSVNERANLAAFSCLLLALGVVVAFFNGWILIIGSHVIRSWIVSCALLLAALVLLWVRAKKHRSDNVNDGIWGRMRPIVTFLLVVAVGVGSAIGAFFDIGTHNLVLDPRGPDGCQLVVRESAFLMSGRGEVFAVNAIGIGRSAGKWDSNREYRPVEAGLYTLIWGPVSGELTVSGATVSRTRQENIAQRESLQPRIDSGEIPAEDAYARTPFDRQPIHCR